jgi:predicted phage terminase large subunit-like protein
MSSLKKSLQVSRHEAARELLLRRKARRCLHDFITYINPDYIVSDFSISVCAVLDEFIAQMINGERPILLLSAPPQHGKSDIVSRYLPAFMFGIMRDIRIGGLSYGKSLATDMNRDVQRIMLGDNYAAVFPESTLNKRRVVTIEIEAKRNSETFEIVGSSGSYISQGVGGPLTGKKLDLGIIDDPIKNSKEALSQTVKDGIWNWYTSTFLTRLSKNSGQIIMATRWAVDDLSGRIQKTMPKAKTIKYSAITDGVALIPQLHPLEKLLETKSQMSDYFWSAMYQQEPVALGGNLFKSEWWRYYASLPPIEYYKVYADTAQKTGQENDYSVFQLWGKAQSGIYLIDQVRGKWEAPELLVSARAFWAKHSSRAGLRCMMIEDKVSGTGLIQMLKREKIPVIGIPRDRDKLTRALDVLPCVENGMVHLPESAPWLSDFLVEASSFPTASHDDQVDPLIDAVSDMLVKIRSFVFEV